MPYGGSVLSGVPFCTLARGEEAVLTMMRSSGESELFELANDTGLGTWSAPWQVCYLAATVIRSLPGVHESARAVHVQRSYFNASFSCGPEAVQSRSGGLYRSQTRRSHWHTVPI